MIRTIILLVVVFTCLYSTEAQWKPTQGPYGGTVHSLALSGSAILAGLRVHPDNSSLVLQGGIYKSTDEGISWTKSDSGIISSPPKADDKDIRVIKVVGDVIFAGSLTGIYRSTDIGDTWKQVLQLPSGDYNDIVSIAGNGSFIYAAISNKYTSLFQSTDAGLTWKGLDEPKVAINAMEVIGGTLFAGSFYGINRTDDNGKTWEDIDAKLKVSGLTAMLVTGKYLYMTIGTSAFRSADKGETWTEMKVGLPKIVTNEPRKLFAGKSALFLANSVLTKPSSNPSYYEIYKSTDNGDTWQKLEQQLPHEIVNCIAENGTSTFAGTSQSGIYKSDGGGGAWYLSNQGFQTKSIASLHKHGAYIFAGTTDNRIYRSSDNGNNWELFGDSWLLSRESDGIVNSITSNLSEIFVATSGGLYRSSSLFPSFTKCDTGMKNNQCLSIGYVGDILYASTYGGMYISYDNANTWRQGNNGMISYVENPTDSVMRFVGGHDEYIYCGLERRGIYRSTNQGASWKRIDTGKVYYNFNCVLSYDSIVIVGSSYSIYRSTNWGDNMRYVNLESQFKSPVQTLVKSGNNLFAGTGSGGVFRSTNNGETWFKMNEGLKDLSIKVLYVSGNDLYAGTKTSGVWKIDLNTIGALDVKNEEIKGPNYFRVYPNPATNTLTIDRTNLQFPENKPVHYKFSTLVGGKVMEFVNSEPKFTVQLGGIPSGVYCLTAESTGSRAAVMVTVVE